MRRPMSGNNPSSTPAAAPPAKSRAPDQRIRRTQMRLGAAVIELIQEKPIGEVTVQDVLDRASIGRSTFYQHFRDKDDLLIAQLEGALEHMSTMLLRTREKSRRVVAVNEILSHIGARNKIYQAFADAGRLSDFYDLAQGYFARGIAQRLREISPTPKPSQRELNARGVALAGSLLALLRW